MAAVEETAQGAFRLIQRGGIERSIKPRGSMLPVSSCEGIVMASQDTTPMKELMQNSMRTYDAQPLDRSASPVQGELDGLISDESLSVDSIPPNESEYDSLSQDGVLDSRASESHLSRIDRGIEHGKLGGVLFDELATKKHLTGYLRNNKPGIIVDEHGTSQPDASEPIRIGFSKGGESSALIISERVVNRYTRAEGVLDHDFMVMLDVEECSREVGGTKLDFVGQIQIAFWVPVWDTDEYGHVRRDRYESWNKLLIECIYPAYVTTLDLGLEGDIDLWLPSGGGTFTWDEGNASRQGLDLDNEVGIMKAFDDKWQPMTPYVEPLRDSDDAD